MDTNRSYPETIDKLYFSNSIVMGLVERSGVIYKPGTIGYLYHDFNNPYDLVYHDGYFVVTTTVNNNPEGVHYIYHKMVMIGQLYSIKF